MDLIGSRFLNFSIAFEKLCSLLMPLLALQIDFGDRAPIGVRPACGVRPPRGVTPYLLILVSLFSETSIIALV